MKRKSSILEVVKKYWYLLVIATLTILVVLTSFMGQARVSQLVNTLKKTSENYKKRIEVIEDLSERKTIADKESLKQHEEAVKQIKQKKKKQIKKINETKLKLVEKLKDESAEELAKKMKEEFKL